MIKQGIISAVLVFLPTRVKNIRNNTKYYKMLALRQLIRFNSTTNLFIRSSSVLIKDQNKNYTELYNERRILEQNTPMVTIYRNKYDKSRKSKRDVDDDEVNTMLTYEIHIILTLLICRTIKKKQMTLRSSSEIIKTRK